MIRGVALAFSGLVSMVVLLLAPMIEQDVSAAGLNVGALPAEAMPFVEPADTALAGCPDLPLAWLIAQMQVESSFDPDAVSPDGAAGLLQMMPATWTEAGGPGSPWPTPAGPPAGHPVFDPDVHLPVAVDWMCANLRAMTAHIAATGKPITGLQAMAVCHLAGCSRVLGSATGLPIPGEAGCDSACVGEIEDYLARIGQLAAVYGALGPGTLLDGALPPPPTPYLGGASGCVLPDPTVAGGCLTGATLHGFNQITLASGGRWAWGASCWSAHTWNPSSDHPSGRACDLTVGQAGQFPPTDQAAHGWAFAEWLRVHRTELRVSYVIWQGRIWSAGRDAEGWRPYTGGGIYDATSATGGHYDHLHISWTM